MVHKKYNTKLNTKPKIFKFYTPWELFAGAIMSISPVMVTIISGGEPSPGDAIIVFALYTIFLVYFKVGKPEGYLEHLLKHFFTPHTFRPGFKSPEFPVCKSLEEYTTDLAKTPEQLKADLIELQKRLTRAGLIRVTAYGSFLKVDIEDEDSAHIVEAALAVLEEGKVLAIDEKNDEV